MNKIEEQGRNKCSAKASDTIRQHCLFCRVKRIDCELESSPANEHITVAICIHKG